MSKNTEKKDRIDVKSSEKEKKQKTEDKQNHSRGDAGFGVDVGYVDKRNYIFD